MSKNSAAAPLDAYNELKACFRSTSKLKAAENLLLWEAEISMPPASGDVRGDILSELRQQQQKLLVHPSNEYLLNRAAEGEFDEADGSNLREMSRLWKHAAAIPESLDRLINESAGKTQNALRQARENEENIPVYIEQLSRLLEYQMEAAGIKSSKFGMPLYDTFLDLWEPGLTKQRLDALFGSLKPILLDMLANSPDQNDMPVPTMPIENQKHLCGIMLRASGYDFNHGRLDGTYHAFSLDGVPNDYRITTSFDEKNFLKAIHTMLHEAGHAAYEAGLPKGWIFQPVGAPRGAAFHESQALLFERHVGKSPEYREYIARELSNCDHETEISSKKIAVWQHSIQPNSVRLKSDEISYALHIILRYEVENKLLAGHLRVSEIEEYWNALTSEYLGITPVNLFEGWLQDWHWALGLFGYFPTYLAGAVLSAQIFESARNGVSNLHEDLKRGDLMSLRNWLRIHIHEKASLLTFDDLVYSATGRPLGTDAYLNSLHNRYGC